MGKHYKHDVITLDNGVTIDAYKVDRARRIRMVVGAVAGVVVTIGVAIGIVRHRT